MEAREHLYYGIGMIAYSVAKADGTIQESEKRELHNLIHEWSEKYSDQFDVTEIIFSLFDKTKPTLEEGLKTGLKHIGFGSEHLTEQIKEQFIYLLQDIAHAYPPVTETEGMIIKRVQNALNDL